MKWTLKDVSWLSVVLIFIILMTPPGGSLRIIMSVFTESVLQHKDIDMLNPPDSWTFLEMCAQNQSFPDCPKLFGKSSDSALA